ncbi:MAG: HAMP domain-containing histidine kinase [Hyphomicrobiales bacterium]|nr:HAMP domain-containing histidine kinase [Hyphomicrobiales bacterium]
MTALGKLFRTTAFKLAVVYSIVFAAAASIVVFNVGRQVRIVLEDQIAETLDADIRGLADQYSQGGVQQLVQSIERRIRQPGGDIYLLTSFAGDPIVGNIATLPKGVLEQTSLIETIYQRPGESKATHHALARVFTLSGNYRLLVGHDVEELENLRRILRHALASSLGWLVLIGAVGGLLVARRVLMRVDAMSASATAIMGGDLAERLPVGGSGDELDRLAENLNAMLTRIETLLKGMKEVSDNIAHDLRTPLTRLRNNADAAMRELDPQAQKLSLGKVIEDADELIKIFDALLMIARAESGSGPKMELVDVTQTAADVAELYEAAAEERGVAFGSDIEQGLMVRGSRELIAQALSNLLDNGLKYGVPPAPGASASLRLSARRQGSMALIAVEDRGPGVPPEDRDRVLERFVRLEASRTLPGSGLGLSLVAAIARLHGGALKLEDNAPGLCAIVELPIASGPPQLAAPPRLEQLNVARAH